MGKQLKIVLRRGGRERKKNHIPQRCISKLTTDESGGYHTKLVVTVAVEDINVTKRMITLRMVAVEWLNWVWRRTRSICTTFKSTICKD